MPLSRLILSPKNPLLELPVSAIVEPLLQQSVTESPLPIAPYGEGSYLVGERFFEAFLFLGCSPAIELTPTEDNAPFCYLQIESECNCRLISGENLKAACKQCKQRYRGLEVAPSAEIPQIGCDHCGAERAADQIAWRKTAALSKTRISLWNIFEGEAVPSDSLLSMLQQLSGERWVYAYIS